MNKTVIINVVGLTQGLIGLHTPFLAEWSGQGAVSTVKPVLPAVTCSMQSTYLTGKQPSEHGIVGNGWYYKDECEVKFWKQSNNLVSGKKIWDTAKEIDPSFTCANMFWWHNMYSTVDYSATPRPIYAADGRKFPDCYTRPTGLRDEIQARLGVFPLFNFWGPNTAIRSSQWIADASMIVEQKYSPTLTLIYLPHLDYNLQRAGLDDPSISVDLNEIDKVCAGLIRFYESKGAQVIVLSEYGITNVNNPVLINRELRRKGYIAARNEQGREVLDPGAGRAFAVVDHQIAHIYVNDKSKTGEIRNLIENIKGVERVLGDDEKIKFHLNHSRSGDLIAVADESSWFAYYYWLDDKKAPDFADTVDIHRKPGYDPVELFLNPEIPRPKLQFMITLLKKKLGFRYLMNFIPLDPFLVKGSHGRQPDGAEGCPVIITKSSELLPAKQINATQVHDIILAHLAGK